MKLSEFKINSQAIEKGEWIGEIPNLGDVRIHTRGAGNSDWRQLQSEMVAKVAKDQTSVSAKDQDSINLACLLEAGLIGWENLQDDNGATIPFSRETAEALMSDPDCRVFFDGAIYAASVVGRKRVTRAADAAKN